MRKPIIRIVVFIFIMVLTWNFSCETPESYPTTPQVEYKNFLLQDSVDLLGNPVLNGVLVFQVIDGDGNIGLSEQDSARGEEYRYNLFIDLYEKKNGEFVKRDFSVALNYRIPRVPEPKGNNKTLKADIKVKMTNDLNFLESDTFKYQFYIKDRDLNKSNTEETPVFVLSDINSNI